MEVRALLLLITCLTSECQSVIKHGQEGEEKKSFLWRVESTPPSYFFGTIHVPYVRVWDAIPQNAKQAFAASKRVFFELDLTKANTITALGSCQALPRNRHLSQEIPSELFARLKIHMEYIKKVIPSWITPDQEKKGLDAQYLFSAITANWERKRPIWVTLIINSLTKSDFASRGYPVLDLYLSQLALKNRKRVSAIETVDEQCQPLNQLNKTLVAFALDQTLKQLEELRLGLKDPYFSTDDLIRHYRNGNLDAVIFNQETIMFPSLAHEKTSDMEPMTLREKELANNIDDYFRENMINERNRRMASRVINLLVQHPRTPFFFAFGAAHFVGEHTVLDFVESAGFTIKQIGHNETLPELFSMQMSPHGRNTVQGTFDDLSDEEKTRAYLQFLQYHQQLEQKNETKRFQEMLNHGEKTITQANSNSDNTVPTNDSLRIWYGLKNRGHSCSSSLSMSSLMIMILMVFYHMLP